MVEHSLQKRSAEEASMPDCRTEPWPSASNDTCEGDLGVGTLVGV